MRADRSLAGLAVTALAVVAAGCGGGDDDGSSGAATQATTAAAAPPPAASRDLTIKMSDYAFDPADAVAKSGKVTITTPNEGQTVHELVLLKTDEDPAKLPKKNGEVDESDSVGEIADVDAGATKSGKFDLKPGTYAMVCALPGHYEAGMYGSLTVK